MLKRRDKNLVLISLRKRRHNDAEKKSYKPGSNIFKKAQAQGC